MLPLTREDISSNGNYAPSQTSLPSFSQQSRVPKSAYNLGNNGSKYKIPYLKRLANFKSLDFETALWEMLNLIIRPKRVYKSLYYQTQTRNKWSREDPSFILLLSLLLTISAIFWGIVYSHSVLGILKLILYMVVVDFWVVGVIVATIGWVVASKFMVVSGGGMNNNNLLEWSYCFDVHCNSYLIIWLSLYFCQFFFLPILKMNNFVSTILGNTLYLIALSYYSLITFYGYNALPFLHKTEYLLLPTLVFLLLWFFFIVTGFNLANYMSTAYFI